MWNDINCGSNSSLMNCVAFIGHVNLNGAECGYKL